jgi:hypothetical protein
MYVEKLACFLRGIDCWALETERYFGTKCREIQGQRVVDLLPKAESVAPILMAPAEHYNLYEISKDCTSIDVAPYFPVHVLFHIILDCSVPHVVKLFSIL